MQRLLAFVFLSVLAVSPSNVWSQDGSPGNTSGAQGGSPATNFYQSQVYSGIGGSGQTGATQGIPYDGDPSRFTYNRPSVRSGGVATSPHVPTYNFNVRPGRRFYHGYYPFWNGQVGYRFGPYVYYPRTYYVAPGVTQHIGPFIPIR